MERELNEDELSWIYDKGECPFCGCTKYLEGPEGGMCMNITCANEECGAVMNISPYFKSYMGELLKFPKNGKASRSKPFDASIVKYERDHTGKILSITRYPYKPVPIVTVGWWRKLWQKMVA